MMIVISCSCKNDYQDKKYGMGKRIFNESRDNKWTCTVCGKTIIKSGVLKKSEDSEPDKKKNK